MKIIDRFKKQPKSAERASGRLSAKDLSLVKNAATEQINRLAREHAAGQTEEGLTAAQAREGTGSNYVDRMRDRIDELGGDRSRAAQALVAEFQRQATIQAVGSNDPYGSVEVVELKRPKSYSENTSLARRTLAQLRQATGLTRTESGKRIPGALGQWKEFKRRVDTLTKGITDENLDWSVNRMRLVQSQEGFHREGDMDKVVNNWGDGHTHALSQLSSNDWEGSFVDFETIMKVFEQGINREDPIDLYQFTSAQVLHDYMPAVAHFMGKTLQELIILTALKGEVSAQEVSIWGAEEMRHANVLVNVYNGSKIENRPALEAQGISAKTPYQSEKWAKSMMANRGTAELFAGAAYLMLMGNAKPGSPAIKALDGIWRDEVYHYVVMSAVNWEVYGQTNSLKRFYNIARHSFDGQNPTATDAIEHERKGLSPLGVMQLLYAAKAINKRIQTYLKQTTGENADALKELVGKYYKTDAEVEAAVKAGKHTLTPYADQEQNPMLTEERVRTLQARFPGLYDEARRQIDTAMISDVLARFRETKLSSPQYWLRKEGMEQLTADAGGTTLAKSLGDATMRLEFPAGGKASVTLSREDETLFSATLDDLPLLQIGLLMSAEDSSVLEKFKEEKYATDLPYDVLVRRMGARDAYRESPIRLNSAFVAD
ncbi:MAG: hypothetical protein IPJ65_35370 [Archangiaceae bacterium]|nr:hypothetical protein [Archangiaceae bacterium]